MKKTIIILASIFLVSSCIVRSLQAFYSLDNILKIDLEAGTWANDKNQFDIVSLKFFSDTMSFPFLGDNKTEETADTSNLSPLELAIYKNAFILIDKTSPLSLNEWLLAVPFHVGNDTLLDFTPLLEDETIGEGDIARMHMVSIHSLAKLNVFSDKKIKISWLSESAIENMLREHRIKIKYETIGMNKNRYLLTASSQDLQKFIKKYLESHQDTLWESSVKMLLNKKE